MTKNIYLFVFVIANFLFSCKTVEKNTLTTKSLHHHWILTHLNKNAVLAVESTKNISLQLDTISNKFRGFGGCNSYSGTFGTDDKKNITFFKMISTKKYCAPPSIESLYFSTLSKSTSYILTEKELILYENTIEIARFKKE